MSDEKKSPVENRTAIFSLVKVLQHFGVKDLEKIFEDNQDTDDKIEWEKLQKIARKHGVRSNLIRPTVEELRELDYPVIAKMADGSYVPVGSLNDEVVLVIDPRQQKAVAIPIKEFLEQWTNDFLVFSAALSWTYFKKRYNIDWFTKVIVRYKKPLSEVMAAMFFLPHFLNA